MNLNLIIAIHSSEESGLQKVSRCRRWEKKDLKNGFYLQKSEKNKGERNGRFWARNSTQEAQYHWLHHCTSGDWHHDLHQMHCHRLQGHCYKREIAEAFLFCFHFFLGYVWRKTERREDWGALYLWVRVQQRGMLCKKLGPCRVKPGGLILQR